MIFFSSFSIFFCSLSLSLVSLAMAALPSVVSLRARLKSTKANLTLSAADAFEIAEVVANKLNKLATIIRVFIVTLLKTYAFFSDGCASLRFFSLTEEIVNGCP